MLAASVPGAGGFPPRRTNIGPGWLGSCCVQAAVELRSNVHIARMGITRSAHDPLIRARAIQVAQPRTIELRECFFIPGFPIPEKGEGGLWPVAKVPLKKRSTF